MATKANRGTKRTCQGAECGVRFYDLGRDPISCPMCGAAFVPVVVVASAAEARRSARRPPPPPVQQVAESAATAEGEEALAAVAEGEEAAPAAAEGDETFLEEEDEGGDVTTIIGGVAEGEEEV